MTDKEGKVKFTTIYAGWYGGRTIHIDYKIRTKPNSNEGFEHTSQLYFDDKITKNVMKEKSYLNRHQGRISHKRD